MKSLYFYFITITGVSATVPKDICETCVPTYKCPLFGNLNKNDQVYWMENFSCGTRKYHQVVPPGFSATAKGDYICCSNNIWGFENSEQIAPHIIHKRSSKLVQTNEFDYLNNNRNNVIPNQQHNPNGNSNSRQDYHIENSRQGNASVWYPDRNQNYNNQNYWSIGNVRPTNADMNKWSNNRNKYWNDRPTDRQWNIGKQNFNNDKNYSTRQDMQFGNKYEHRTSQGSPFISNQPRQPFDNYDNNHSRRNQNNFSNNNRYPNIDPQDPNNNNNNPGNPTGQCEHLTSFPPDPQSGCCGREVADEDRITDGNVHKNFAPAYTHHWAQPPHYSSGEYLTFRNKMQKRAAADNTTTVRVDNRISGGKATELNKYPWTVLLLTTFDYGNRLAGFNCGGSLISAKYVLSAGHCVYDRKAVIKSVAVNLAEYDKRTFPRDCKVSQHGRKCIENIVMYAENIIIHPQYENENLINDISLIRLQGSAPYTQYIRPICLPSINIDEPQYSNLQFEVAGWGRNGQYNSNVKQSTVLHLVNQNECRRFYPMLTTKHLCAAGYKGADTCKGDSGGPLMILYRGRYYATGLVSGKRADSPCGTAVPSLYTNIYHYLDWIQSTIRN